MSIKIPANKLSNFVKQHTSEVSGKKGHILMIDDFGERFEPMKAGKFAPVAPFHIYQQFAVNGYVPKTVLLLAHDVVAHPEGYHETFSDPLWHDTTIIMDNSLVELKKAVDTEMVFNACEIVAADIAVLPDVMGDGLSTFVETEKVYNEWKWKFREYELMALIHGKDVQEWFHCAYGMANHCPTPWVGIPRITANIRDQAGNFYTRSDLVDFVDLVYSDKPKIHLFGFSDYPWLDITDASYQRVSSIDSAVPLRQKEGNIFADAGPRGDWWESVTYEKWMIDNCLKVDSMINRD